MKVGAGMLLMLVATLVQVTWASQLEVAGAFPNLVLVAVVVLTWTQGVRAGLVWACAGGILLDLNAAGPLGPHAVALLAGAYSTGFWARNLDRESVLHPMGAVVLATVLYSLVLVGSDAALGLPVPTSRVAIQLIVAASLFNAALTLPALAALRRAAPGLHSEQAT